MATDPSELYPVISQIAAAFAWFGSLASGLGQRRGGDDASVDAFRLGMILFASLSATLLGLLPALLSGLMFKDQEATRIAAAVAGIVVFVYLPIPFVRARELRDMPGFNRLGAACNATSAITALIAFALCAFDTPSGRVPGLYLLGLMGLLGSSIVMFSRVMVSMLRPHSKAMNREI